jgi:hypothetical protein
MSDAEKQQLLDAIHKQLDHAISYNLYSGIAYGTFIRLIGFCLFTPEFRYLGMFFAVYCISIRILLSAPSFIFPKVWALTEISPV